MLQQSCKSVELFYFSFIADVQTPAIKMFHFSFILVLLQLCGPPYQSLKYTHTRKTQKEKFYDTSTLFQAAKI